MKIKVFLGIILLILYTASCEGQIVYVTKTGKKYHQESCRFLKYSKKEITIKKAKEFGFLACRICKPTIKNTSSKNTTSSLSSNKKKQDTRKVTATQCTGKTKSGRRCKRKTKNANGRCYQH